MQTEKIDRRTLVVYDPIVYDSLMSTLLRFLDNGFKVPEVYAIDGIDARVYNIVSKDRIDLKTDDMYFCPKEISFDCVNTDFIMIAELYKDHIYNTIAIN